MSERCSMYYGDCVRQCTKAAGHDEECDFPSEDFVTGYHAGFDAAMASVRASLRSIGIATIESGKP